MKEYTTLSQELAKLSPERKERIKARASKIYFQELTLKYLQDKLGISEAELAQCFTEAQPTSTKMEGQEGKRVKYRSRGGKRTGGNIGNYHQDSS